jgi:hypothetical protein
MLTRIVSLLELVLQAVKEPTIEPLVEPVTNVDVPAAEGVACPRITYAVAIMLLSLQPVGTYLLQCKQR